LYSRFEKFFLKLFTDERQMHTQIFIDCSASMGKECPEKGAYAVAIAAALGYLSVHNMDKVSYKLMREDKAEDPFGTIVGKRAFFNAMSTIDSLKYEGSCDLKNAIINTPNPGNNDGLTVIISDFYTRSDWRAAVDYLCYKKRQVLLVQVLTPDEVDPVYSGRMNLIDSESLDVTDSRNMKLKIDRASLKAYSMAMLEHTTALKQFCASREAAFITVCTDEPVERVLFKELLKVGIMA
jgi:uncharacterized protein (DUF58 family)